MSDKIEEKLREEREGGQDGGVARGDEVSTYVMWSVIPSFRVEYGVEGWHGKLWSSLCVTINSIRTM